MIFERFAPGRPRHPYTKEILQLRKDGKTYGQIELKLKIARSTVSTICQNKLSTDWERGCVLCSPKPCKGHSS